MKCRREYPLFFTSSEAEGKNEGTISMKKKVFDLVVIGGGVIGSSIAYNLVNDGIDASVLVIEKDPTYEFASTTLCAGGVREQFSRPENIKIAQYSLNIYENFDEIMQVDGDRAHAEFIQRGYLILANERNWPAVKRNYKRQKNLGVRVSLLSGDEIKEMVPHINTGDVVGASFGSRDGTLDPYGVMQGYIKKAKNLGAEYLYEEVTKIETRNGKVESVTTNKGSTIRCNIIVNAAGPHAPIVGKMAGIDLPIDPTRRMVYLFDPKEKFDYELPFVFDTDRELWFRHETGKMILVGKNIPETPGFNFNWDRDFFTHHVWPAMAKRIPVLDTGKLTRGWAGLYALNRIDQNAIIGRLGDIQGFYGAVGFSGHGLMQSPAVGKCMSELLQFGEYQSIDLSCFGFERFKTGKLVFEDEIV
jgi:FAD-dependent oxidoreductase domain-containing protein 1